MKESSISLFLQRNFRDSLPISWRIMKNFAWHCHRIMNVLYLWLFLSRWKDFIYPQKMMWEWHLTNIWIRTRNKLWKWLRWRALPSLMHGSFICLHLCSMTQIYFSLATTTLDSIQISSIAANLTPFWQNKSSFLFLFKNMGTKSGVSSIILTLTTTQGTGPSWSMTLFVSITWTCSLLQIFPARPTGSLKNLQTHKNIKWCGLLTTAWCCYGNIKYANLAAHVIGQLVVKSTSSWIWISLVTFIYLEKNIEKLKWNFVFIIYVYIYFQYCFAEIYCFIGINHGIPWWVA